MPPSEAARVPRQPATGPLATARRNRLPERRESVPRLTTADERHGERRGERHGRARVTADEHRHGATRNCLVLVRSLIGFVAIARHRCIVSSRSPPRRPTASLSPLARHRTASRKSEKATKRLASRNVVRRPPKWRTTARDVPQTTQPGCRRVSSIDPRCAASYDRNQPAN